MRKPTIWVSTSPTQTKLYNHRRRLEVSNFGFKKNRNCTICVAKSKAVISFAVTAKLICAFVFAYADCWFSDAVAQMENKIKKLITYSGFEEIKSKKTLLTTL